MFQAEFLGIFYVFFFFSFHLGTIECLFIETVDLWIDPIDLAIAPHLFAEYANQPEERSTRPPSQSGSTSARNSSKLGPALSAAALFLDTTYFELVFKSAYQATKR